MKMALMKVPENWRSSIQSAASTKKNFFTSQDDNNQKVSNTDRNQFSAKSIGVKASAVSLQQFGQTNASGAAAYPYGGAGGRKITKAAQS